MNLWRTFKVAWEGLTLNKVRSFLTTLGVIIGVGSVIIMMAVSAGAEAEIADQINALGANLIMVMPAFGRGGFGPGTRRPPSLTYDDIGAIAQNVTGLNGVSAEQNTTQDVKDGGTTLEDVSVVGTTAGFTGVRDYHVGEGRFLTDEDCDRANKVAVLGYDVAQELFGGQSAVGQSVKIGSVKLMVVGVMEPKGVVGNTDYDARAYIPITLVFKRFTDARFGGDDVHFIYVSAESKDMMESVMSQVTELLLRRHETDETSPGFNLVTQDNIIDAQASTTEAFRSLLAWVAGISLVVGGIGIMNIMLASVTERTREIGIRRALGAKKRDIIIQFLTETVLLSGSGGVLGLLIGIGIPFFITYFAHMVTIVRPWFLFGAFGISIAIGVIFGMYPAYRASIMNPITALRHE